MQHIAWARVLAMPYAIQQSLDVDDTEEFADACLGFVKASQTYTEAEGTSFFTYGATAARNTITAGRKARERMRGLSNATRRPRQVTRYMLELVVDHRTEYLEGLFTIEQILKFMEAVGELPERDRAMVLMRIEGHTHREVGDRFSVSRTVSLRAEARSMKTLFCLLKEHFREE